MIQAWPIPKFGLGENAVFKRGRKKFHGTVKGVMIDSFGLVYYISPSWEGFIRESELSKFKPKFYAKEGQPSGCH